MISFSAGALLGDAFIHLLPELVAETGFTLKVSLYILSYSSILKQSRIFYFNINTDNYLTSLNSI